MAVLTSSPTFLLLAGEASGDQYGARLTQALKRRYPEASFVGLGGPAMKAEGVKLLAELRDQGIDTELHIAGKKGIQYFRFRGEPLETQRVDISDAPSSEDDASESLSSPGKRMTRAPGDRAETPGATPASARASRA